MGKSDKEAFEVLDLPLGVDKDAIRDRYKTMSSKLASSKLPEDKKKLEEVVAAYKQLLPNSIAKNNIQNNKPSNDRKNPRNHNLYDDDDSSSDDDTLRGHCRNGDSRLNHIMQGDEIIDRERDRRKAERRKAKKKRRKEKKKLEKLENKYSSSLFSFQRDDDSDSDDDDEPSNMEEEQGIDPKSAFVAVAGRKISNINTWKQVDDSKKFLTKATNGQDDLENQTILLDPETRSIQSRQLAIKGNEEANNGEYEKAVRLFSEAIRYESNDHRFFGNRSYCYDQLGQFEKALKDAERSIKLAPEWPKGHFRRGRALKGLGKYSEAETAFQKVLCFDEECDDALTEIVKVRRKRIVEMGFTEEQAKAAIKKYILVPPALDALLTGEFTGTLDHIFFSDDEEVIEEPVRTLPTVVVASDVKMNPRNPEGLTSLWVGNVVPEINEKQLSKVFNKYGTVVSVRLLKEKYCAFINFSNKDGASRAITALQGYEIGGSKLLIKFPDNPIINGTSNVVLRKTNTTTKKTTNQNISEVSSENIQRSKGPVNGDECYFWRTTGCAFGDACKHKHIPNCKGIDRKPWQK